MRKFHVAASVVLLAGCIAPFERHVSSGRQLARTGRFAEARDELKAALHEAEASGVDESKTFEIRNRLAMICERLGEGAEADSHLREAVTIAERAFGPTDKRTSMAHFGMGVLCLRRSEFDRAEEALLRAKEIDEELPPRERDELAVTLDSLADLYVVQARFDEAADCIQKALAARKEASAGERGPKLAGALVRAAAGLADIGRTEDAERMRERAASSLESLLADRAAPVEETVALHLLGSLKTHWGQSEEATLLLTKAAAKVRRRRRAMMTSMFLVGDLSEEAGILADLGLAYAAGGDFAEAEEQLAGSLKIWRKLARTPDREPVVADCLHKLGQMLFAQQAYDRAQTELERALAVSKNTFLRDDEAIALVSASLAALHRARGNHGLARDYDQRWADALRAHLAVEPEAWLKKLLAVRRRCAGADHPCVAEVRGALAVLSSLSGKTGEAAEHSVACMEGYEDARPEPSAALAGALELRAHVLREAGRSGDAQPLEARAGEMRAKRRFPVESGALGRPGL